MTAYRLYFVGIDGHFIGVEIIEADDDKAAIEIARTLAGPQPMELWCLDRRVEKFPAISSGQARSG
jgi:hypothetical protein